MSMFPNPFINQFPYMDAHEMNLDWIIKTVKALFIKMEEYEAVNHVEYKGFWNITSQYPKWSIVYNESTGDMMISVKIVPSGISITNTDYWILVSPFKIDKNFNSESYNAIANKTVTDKFNSVDGSIQTINTDLTALHTTDESLLNTITQNTNALNLRIDSTNEALGDEEDARESADAVLDGKIDTNTASISSESNARQVADAALSARIDSIASLPEGSTTADAELMDIRVAGNGETYDTAGEAVRGQFDQITDKMSFIVSPNKWNPDLQKDGYVDASGSFHSSTTYATLETPIKVKPGDIVRCYVINNNVLISRGIRFLAAYDITGTVVSGSGSGSEISSYTVPADIYGVIPSILKTDKIMITINETATYFTEYFASYYQANDGFISDLDINADTDFENVYMDYSMVNRMNPDECETGKYITKDGADHANAGYFASDYLAIRPGETLHGYYKSSLNPIGFRCVAAYDSNYNVLSAYGSNNEVYSYTQDGPVAYVRVSISYNAEYTATYPSNIMVISSDAPMEAVDYGNEPVFKAKYIPTDNKVDIHVYLPSEIPVGIGRTIELYNDLVCLEADKYHLKYTSTVGIQYERKYSINTNTEGDYPLTLRIYDDNMKLVWSGSSVIKVADNNISDTLNVIPIGDSLTNLKPWLNEVQTLSNNKIKFIGTRGRSDQTIRCEGRSGLTALAYNTDFNYTFDYNYVGNPEINSNVNPFYDGTRFNLAYYNTYQGPTVGVANAVILFLGTNDVFGSYTAEQSADHIKTLVDNIRTDYEDLPIFVCNTIYRSNQNGYYSTGGQGYTAASGWGFDSDMRIMNFQNALRTALTGYTNLHIMPLSICMDREYDFGNVPTPVNPRLTDVTINIPTESVHPQNPGYMQIADVMYSSLVNHLS